MPGGVSGKRNDEIPRHVIAAKAAGTKKYLLFKNLFFIGFNAD
jgi:hypothetical protein